MERATLVKVYRLSAALTVALWVYLQLSKEHESISR